MRRVLCLALALLGLACDDHVTPDSTPSLILTVQMNDTAAGPGGALEFAAVLTNVGTGVFTWLDCDCDPSARVFDPMGHEVLVAPPPAPGIICAGYCEEYRVEPGQSFQLGAVQQFDGSIYDANGDRTEAMAGVYEIVATFDNLPTPLERRLSFRWALP